ncbi:hypothetical protein Patl1_33464 [Pistacia atlantica]|uniref:Uncharacterized protein n=1 Tax=Pistacia atlantica TaxID=434234 RepID=A0ACC0ZU67_9ROSI|nr:hypothetical protein Patl1_33464 [Pistacia atlantica]
MECKSMNEIGELQAGVIQFSISAQNFSLTIINKGCLYEEFYE